MLACRLHAVPTATASAALLHAVLILLLSIYTQVGLPGRGKTYIARKVARYLRWINYRTRAFSLARYRIERCGARQQSDFFDNDNEVTANHSDYYNIHAIFKYLIVLISNDIISVLYDVCVTAQNSLSVRTGSHS
jgi:6-phosphofructo-2-kinase